MITTERARERSTTRDIAQGQSEMTKAGTETGPERKEREAEVGAVIATMTEKRIEIPDVDIASKPFDQADN